LLYKNLKVWLCGLLMSSPLLVFAQDDLLGALEDSASEPETEYVKAAFKGTRVINAHSLENLTEGVLDFRIMHRFNPLTSGAENFFGLDAASTRLQLDYGIKDYLQVGLGRSGNNKTFTGYGKYKFLRQSKGKRNMPLSAIYVASVDFYHGKPNINTGGDPYYYSHRFSYVHQLIAGRKFSEAFSAQLMPTFIHRNIVPIADAKNDVVAIGAGIRQKLSHRVAVNAEYFYTVTKRTGDFANSFTLGFDIETGGHVFQLHFTNTPFMNENGFIAQNTGRWFYKDETTGKLASDVRFGFNISRVFTIYRKGWKPE
jgi:hypothetical protein